MSTPTPSLDRLFKLLPTVYQLRDADNSWQLRALLQVMSQQANAIEADIAQLYENWFIETCQEWVVPYVGDLIAYRPGRAGIDAPGPVTGEEELREKFVIPRREVASTIRFRRRKGTLAVLAELSQAVAGWPARAVEFYKLLLVNQAIDFLRLNRGRIADLRDNDALDLLSGTFDEMGHTIDIRRTDSRHGSGRFNVPSVGLFVWRLRSYPITYTPAYCYENAGDNFYLFSVLGNDCPLFTAPVADSCQCAEAGLLNVPEPIRRRAFAVKKQDVEPSEEPGKWGYYREGKSFAIYAPDWPRPGAPQPIPVECVVPTNLSGWKYHPKKDHIAVDPENGRISFPTRQLPKSGVWVSYHYGFSADMGGGEYPRTLSQSEPCTIYRVGTTETFNTIAKALAQWTQDKPPKAVIEITDGGVYTESPTISLTKDQYLQIRAVSGKRPVLRLLDALANMPDDLSVTGEEGSWFVLDGTVVTGRGLALKGALAGAALRHVTLVPGWGLQCNCEPLHAGEPSIEIEDSVTCVTIQHSIVGSIVVVRDQATLDPVFLHVSDSIVDATHPDHVALSDPETGMAFAELTILRSNVFGAIQVHSVKLAENSIFDGQICVQRGQAGCIRFCYVPPGSITPGRYECQPDMVEAAARAAVLKANPDALPAQIIAAQAAEDLRVQPQFNGKRYGMPTYCQLSDLCAVEIRTGADDESEMGIFHDLFQPQREANLQARLQEFVPAAMGASIFHAT
jgi:hypothetical protein